jgi:hypothetical protein
MLPAQLCDRRIELRLLQEPADLFNRKSLLLHDKISVAIDLILPQNPQSSRSGFPRASHHDADVLIETSPIE